jgi:glycosyltransferase involved in cell wall biosynthesis
MRKEKLKVLIVGWEFPPFHSGGLGVVCYHLTKCLSKQGIEVIFALPKKVDLDIDYMRVLFGNQSIDKITFRRVDSILSPYISAQLYQQQLEKSGRVNIYGQDLFGEVLRYGAEIVEMVKNESFDVIHVHDWLTMAAGLNLKKLSGKPLIVHIHTTEFDRSGNNPDSRVYTLEKQGLEGADIIIAVSNFTKNIIIEHYKIDPAKIKVVYNSVAIDEHLERMSKINLQNKKIVFYIGRLSLHKGPDHLLRAAQKVLPKDPNVIFVFGGKGEMQYQLIEMATQMNIIDKVVFTGFLSDHRRNQFFQSAHLFVLPSVSEPFGIVPLEALSNNVPVLISKQSGVSEILNHCLKVDFWDVDQMANKILAVLRYPVLRESLLDGGTEEIKKFKGPEFNWDKRAEECVQIYKMLIEKM